MMVPFVLLFCVQGVFSAPKNDLISSLPGVNFQVPFGQYSGYLNGSGGVHLHYWMTQSQRNSTTDPVVLWLNGGPGCSSLIGLFTELGAYRIRKGSTDVHENVFAWNKIANVFYMESPAGVGFSYCDNCNIANVGDNSTTMHNYYALVDFFTNKFPEYQNNDFYIAGESYAGYYVPMLSAAVVQAASSFPGKFKGMLVGNGLFSDDLNDNSFITFAYYHGLIGDDTWLPIVHQCCNGTINNCDLVKGRNITWEKEEGDRPNSQASPGQCRAALNKTLHSADNLDIYNIYYACYYSSKILAANEEFVRPTDLPNVQKTHNRLFRSYEGVSATAQNTCQNPLDNTTADYLNSAVVKQALHISNKSSYWQPCNFVVNTHYQQNWNNMLWQFNTVIAAQKKVLVYNGDVDGACNFLGAEWFVRLLNRKVVQTRRPWTYRFDAINVAGWEERYDGFDLLTVRGSGHFVPQDRPREALQMFANFMWNKDYSTPTNISLAPNPMIGTTAAPGGGTTKQGNGASSMFLSAITIMISLMLKSLF